MSFFLIFLACKKLHIFIITLNYSQLISLSVYSKLSRKITSLFSLLRGNGPDQQTSTFAPPQIHQPSPTIQPSHQQPSNTSNNNKHNQHCVGRAGTIGPSTGAALAAQHQQFLQHQQQQQAAFSAPNTPNQVV